MCVCWIHRGCSDRAEICHIRPSSLRMTFVVYFCGQPFEPGCGTYRQNKNKELSSSHCSNSSARLLAQYRDRGGDDDDDHRLTELVFQVSSRPDAKHDKNSGNRSFYIPFCGSFSWRTHCTRSGAHRPRVLVWMCARPARQAKVNPISSTRLFPAL